MVKQKAQKIFNFFEFVQTKNALCPGSVNTELWDTETVKMNFDRSKMLTPEIVAQSILYTAKLPKQAVIDEMTLMPSGGTL